MKPDDRSQVDTAKSHIRKTHKQEQVDESPARGEQKRAAKNIRGSSPEDKEALDDVVIEDDITHAKCCGAFIGFGRCDIGKLDDALNFGEWNKRDLDQKESSRLAESFKRGLYRFRAENAIPVLLERSLLVENTFSSNPMLGLDLPVTQFTRELKKNDLQGCGGQHRRSALGLHYNRIKSQYKLLENQKKENFQLSQEEQKHWGETDEALRKQLKRTLKLEQQWIFAFYDCEGMSDELVNELGHHLSRNNSLYEYKEGPEERLISTVRKRLSKGQDWRGTAAPSKARGADRRHAEVLHQPHMFNTLAAMLKHGNHFTRGSHFTVHKFYDLMTSSYGGVIAWLTCSMGKRLEWCFSDFNIDVNEFSQYKSAFSSPDSVMHGTAREWMRQAYHSICVSDVVPGSLSDDIMEFIDKEFTFHLGTETLASRGLGNKADQGYTNAYDAYVDGVVSALFDYSKRYDRSGEVGMHPSKVQTAVKCCWMKAYIVLKHQDISDNLQSCPYMPFVTVSLVLTLARNCRQVERAWLEVGQWHSPLFSLVGVHPDNESLVGSVTADMIYSFFALPNINKELRASFVDEVMWVLVGNFAAFLRLDRQLKSINLPCLPNTIDQVLPAIGLSADGKRPATNEELVAIFNRKDRRRAEHRQSNNDLNNHSLTRSLAGKAASNTPGPWTSTASGSKPSIKNTSPEMDDRKAIYEEYKVAHDALRKSPKTTYNHELSQPGWLTPWDRKQALPASLLQNSFRGQKALGTHNYEWTLPSPHVSSRTLKVLAALALLSQGVANFYRYDLLYTADSAASYLRSVISTTAAPYIIESSVVKQEHMGAQLQEQDRLTTDELDWPDDFGYSATFARQFQATVSEEMDILQEHTLIKEQNAYLSTIMDAIQKCPFAYPMGAPANDSHCSSQPVLQTQILARVDELADTLSLSAWCHRQGIQVDNIYAEASDIPLEQHLYYTQQRAPKRVPASQDHHAEFIFMSRDKEESLMKLWRVDNANLENTLSEDSVFSNIPDTSNAKGDTPPSGMDSRSSSLRLSSSPPPNSYPPNENEQMNALDTWPRTHVQPHCSHEYHPGPLQESSSTALADPYFIHVPGTTTTGKSRAEHQDATKDTPVEPTYAHSDYSSDFESDSSQLTLPDRVLAYSKASTMTTPISRYFSIESNDRGVNVSSRYISSNNASREELRNNDSPLYFPPSPSTGVTHYEAHYEERDKSAKWSDHIPPSSQAASAYKDAGQYASPKAKRQKRTQARVQQVESSPCFNFISPARPSGYQAMCRDGDDDEPITPKGIKRKHSQSEIEKQGKASVRVASTLPASPRQDSTSPVIMTTQRTDALIIPKEFTEPKVKQTTSKRAQMLDFPAKGGKSGASAMEGRSFT
ncbi:hypothetical protein CONPUDRAFT_78406 [Coniophora puteana RWD-64-598 SS2]|uniref:Uncharacterized protein n=1 Tax=Coniophora puteana (strain RWD-64-598) TaxID=741705 RepID=R7SDW1_CONPW|nr:uncharacterized protein CONPUDRAFT_78406 [Coniophora puteana RWD-64-598 SS2]EIW73942.1 hypothetical protein CONPUDRAFT_78406 [Coniophora puteana RWD-64-598 SS2]